MNRSEILETAAVLSLAGFGSEDSIAFLLAVASEFCEEQLGDPVTLRHLFQLAEDLELALGNQELLNLLAGISFLQLHSKTATMRAVDDRLAGGAKTFKETLRSVVRRADDEDRKAGSRVEPEAIVKAVDDGATWAAAIARWCESNGAAACPVFWSFSPHDVYPLARAVGSFASSAVVLLATQGRRYGIRLNQPAANALSGVLERFLTHYSRVHPELHGAIVFDELDDDYPGSDSNAYDGLPLTCPTLNSSAQALLACAVVESPHLASLAEGLVRFLLATQNPDGSWPIHRFSASELCKPQVMSSALALEAFGALSRNAVWMGDIWSDLAQEVESSTRNGFAFALTRLSEFESVDAAFQNSGTEVARMGTTAIAIQGMLEVVGSNAVDDRQRDEFWRVFEVWSRRLAEAWRPNWKRVIRVRIPVPQWGGHFDPGQFTWELPHDAVISSVLVDAATRHGWRLSAELSSCVFQTVSETLAIQREGVWSDIPMALEGNSRGFPQNAQIYSRLLCAYLASLRRQLNQVFDVDGTMSDGSSKPSSPRT